MASADRQPESQRQQRRRVGADREQPRMPERDLPRRAGDQRQADARACAYSQPMPSVCSM